MNGTFLIRTFGCQMNEHDSERIGGMLRADGMTPTEDVSDARVVVLNTCAIRENADNRLYGNLGHLKPLKAQNPDLRVVVAGCLAQKDQGLIQEKAPWVDVVVGTHALPHLLDLLRRAEDEGPQMDIAEYTELFPSALPAARDDAFRAWVAIAVGCDNACTFCIVPFVRGAQRSRAIGDVLAEVQGLARRGVVEVTLLGQNVNTYGRDVTVPGTSRRPLFAELLRQVNEVDGLRRIRFTSPHPHDFTPDVIEAMAESEKVCEHIHFPLQSGSDAVLKAMQRSYRRERYLGWLDRIRDAIPEVAVSTDIIVGFPGETEEDFADTLDVVDRARFDSAYTFQYSPRPGTRAASMPDQRPEGDRAGAVRAARGAAGARSRSRRRARRSARRPRCSSRAPGGAGRRPSRARGPTGSCTWRERSSRGRSSRLASRTPRRTTSPARSCRRPHWSEAWSRSSLWSARPRPARPRRRCRWRRRSGRRSSRSTRCWCTAAWTSGRPSRRPSSAPGSRTTCWTWSSRARRSAWRRSRPRPARRRTTSAAAGRGRCWWVARASISGRWWTSSSSREPSRTSAATCEGEAAALGAERMHGRLAEMDPAAASKIEPANVRRTVRALEVAAITGRPFSSYAAAWESYPPDRVRAAGIRLTPEQLSEQGRDAGAGDARRRLARRGREARRSVGSEAGSPPRRPSDTLSSPGISRASSSLEDAVRQTVKRTRHLARRQMAWFRRDPRIRWFDAGAEGAHEHRGRSRGVPGGRVSELRVWKYQATGQRLRDDV